MVCFYSLISGANITTQKLQNFPLNTIELSMNLFIQKSIFVILDVFSIRIRETFSRLLIS